MIIGGYLCIFAFLLQFYIKMYINRDLIFQLRNVLQKFPVVTVTGPRQSGKTTFLKNEFPDYTYINLERPDQRDLIATDPLGFLSMQKGPVIFDEAQQYPELFSYIQSASDESGKPGQFILSGSQSFLMNEKIAQSLAGRVYISHLLPFGINELNYSLTSVNEMILKGYYPRLHQQGINANEFYPSYIQTYIERDIRTLKNIGNLHAFSRFIKLCAGRNGQLLNISSLANDCGISVNTAKSWISLLEASFIIFLQKPYYRNFSKRIIKSPRLFFYDTGLAAAMLNIQTTKMISTHYLYGALFENLVISEIIKTIYHNGKNSTVYFWRESNGNEIDCLIETIDNKLIAIEIKGGHTFTTDYLKNLKRFPLNENVQKVLIYAGNESARYSEIDIIAWKDFPKFLKNIP